MGRSQGRTRRGIALSFFLLALLTRSPSAFALDPSLDISQYAHTSWKISDGFSKGPIYSIAQTPDGYLWLGTEFGLLRFDGVRAVPWQPPSDQHLPSNYVTALLGTPDGTLWIGTFKGLAAWKAGKLTIYPQFAELLVRALVEDHQGTIWAGGFAYTPPGKLCAIRNGNVQCYGDHGTLGNGVLGLYEDSKERLWAGVLNGFWRWNPGPTQFYELVGEPNGIQQFAEDHDGTLLTPLGGRVARLAEGKVEVAYPYPGAAAETHGGSILRDHDGGIWIGTYQGLVHVRQGRIDGFGQTDGLSANVVTTLFEDREGSVWVATTRGLDRFRGYPVVTFSENEGLASDYGWTVAAWDGSVWFVTADRLSRWDRGQVTTYYETGRPARSLPTEAQDRVRTRVISGLPVHHQASLFQDKDGRIWVAANGGVGYLHNDRFVSINGVPGDVPFAMAGDAKGNLWISMLDHGLFHLVADKLAQQIPWAALGRNDLATALAVDPSHGGVWLGFSKGGLAYFKDGQISAWYTVADGLGQGSVSNLRFDYDGTLWIATNGGLSRLKDGRLLTLTTRNGLPCDTLHWVIEDGDQALWLYATCGLVRIARSELDGWASQKNDDQKHSVQVSLFDNADGVAPVGDDGNGPQRQPAKSPDAKIWFCTSQGLSVIDPRHLPFNKLPPPVHIEKITADGKTYDPSQGLRLPATVRDVVIEYTALSLVVPEKIHFRYKMDGQDPNWREVTNDRKVQYSNLAPRKYTFRVIACNNSGVWSENGAALDFSVLPAWYQTNWFRALCASVFLALLWMTYQIRVRHLQHQFAITLDARVGERTRIARELHDTLLQTLHGLLMSFQRAANLLPDRPVEAKHRLEGAIDEAAQAITEGRDAVQGLRSSTVVTNELAGAIRTLGEELAARQTNENPPLFDVVVEGTPRNLNPIVRDDIYRIAGEALRNAFQHAEARHVEVELHYDERRLRLRVRDDGKGVAPDVFQNKGRSGHWGLQGMRERAKVAGGHLEIWSEVDSGTEIELSIPASAAYANVPRQSRKGTAVES